MPLGLYGKMPGGTRMQFGVNAENMEILWEKYRL
jgi:hypothetical protein